MFSLFTSVCDFGHSSAENIKSPAILESKDTFQEIGVNLRIIQNENNQNEDLHHYYYYYYYELLLLLLLMLQLLLLISDTA